MVQSTIGLTSGRSRHCFNNLTTMTPLSRAIVFLVLALAALASGSSDYRLPENIKPRHYDILILPSLNPSDNFNFSGSVKIQVVPSENTNKVVLHSKELKIAEDEIIVRNLKDSNDSITLSGVEYDTKWDFLILKLDQNLQKGQTYEIHINFLGRLDGSLVGFYRSSYKDHITGKTEYLAVTQFESTDARRGFPCFDEPAMKATFSMILGRSENLSSISNMPLIETKPISGKEGWFWDKFETSVPMSTYLVAYMISKFDYVESTRDHSNVTFKIWARPEAINQTHYAALIGPKVLSYYEEYFNITYPLPKQDMAAIPDFQAGAMENWGLITYREQALLYSPDSSPVSSQYRVAEVVAHELAHQWFGNLVTMKWWTDLWLNEGFATYVSMIGVEHLHPEWKSKNIEIVNVLSSVYSLDSLNSSHPVSVPIGDPSEISQIFDTISYSKGSALIIMMNEFLGEQTFRMGTTNYLNKFKYQNAEQDDLWESLTEAAHSMKTLPEDMTVKQIMDSWTKQTGFPLVTVNRNYENNTATVSQVRYRRSKEEIEKSPSQVWWVPLSLAEPTTISKQDTKPKHWLKGEKSMELENMPSVDKWVLFNVNSAGIYRVNYDDKNWQLLNTALLKKDFDGIPILNRYTLISDSFDLAWIGQLSYDIAFRILTYVENDSEYLPWKAALGKLSTIQGQFERSSQYGIFKKYARRLITPIYNKLGGMRIKEIQNPNIYSDVLHQTSVSRWACNMEIGSCVENALEFFNEWMNETDPSNNNKIPKNLRSIVYCNSASRLGEKATDFLWQRYLKESVASERDILLSAITCTREAWILTKYLELSITENSGIRSQDAPSVFRNVMSSSIGMYIAREFFYDKIEDIAKYYKSSPSTLSRYIRAVGDSVVSPSETDQFMTWLKNNKEHLKSATLAVKQSLERIQLTKEWREKNFDKLVNILSSFVSEELSNN